MQNGQYKQGVGHHAMLELHGERISNRLRHHGSSKNNRAADGTNAPSICGQVL